MAGDVVRNYKIRYSVQDGATAQIRKVADALRSFEGLATGVLPRIRGVGDEFARLGHAGDRAADAVAVLAGALGRLKGGSGHLAPIIGTLGRIDFNAGTAAVSIARMNAELVATGGTVGSVRAAQEAVQSLQRTSYGAWKNIEEVGVRLGKIDDGVPAIRASTEAMKRLYLASLKVKTTRMTSGGMSKSGFTPEQLKSYSEMRRHAEGLADATARGSKWTDKLSTSFLGMSTSVVGFQAARTVITGVGDAIRDAREQTREWAGDALDLRDQLRELANLMGKAGADDQVVKANLKLRTDTGMNQPEARKFQEQFRGSLPLAKDAGGIDDKTATGLASAVGRLAVRTGMEGGAAGDLAGIMGMFGKVPTAKAGLGQAQQIVDLLNDGRGNLTPLTHALIKGAASTVGPGKAFASLPERAAAISLASGIGNKAGTDTTVGAAIRGLSPGGTLDHQATIKKLGIGGNQSFMERLDRMKPLFDQAKADGVSSQDALINAGFGNITDRRSLIGFYENRETLRKKLAGVQEDPNAPGAKANAAGERSEGLNAAFYSKDKAARNRVATARVDAAKNGRGQADENLEIARKNAEAALIKRGEIDTVGSNIGDKFREGFGFGPMLGFQKGRDIRIDDEVKWQAVAAQEKQLGRKLTVTESNGITLGDPHPAADYLASIQAKQGAAAVAPGAPRVNPGPIKVAGMNPANGQPLANHQGGAGIPLVQGQPAQAVQADPGHGLVPMLNDLIKLTREGNAQRAKAQGGRPLQSPPQVFPLRP